MKTKKQITSIIVALVLMLFLNKSNVAQNHFHMSGYMQDQAYINAASIASYDYISGSVFMKKQWVGMNGAPSFQGITLHAPIKNSPNSIGINMINDVIGVNQKTSASLLYSYRIRVNENDYFSFGTSVALNMLKADYTLINSTDPSDPVFNGNSSYIAPNFSLGMYYFSKKYYIGISSPQLLTNTIQPGINNGSTSFEKENLHFFLHGGSEFKVNDAIKINASTLLKRVSGAPLQIDLNAQINYKDKITLGISGRTSKILVGMFGIKVNNKLKLAYAFDTDFSDLNKVSSGSHEIMLIFGLKDKMILPKIESPRF